MPRLLRPILFATLVAGTLDICAAIGLTLYYARRTVPDMLRYVASGPFPDAPNWGSAGAALGLVVHLLLMAIMAAIYMIAAERRTSLRSAPVKWGVLYGLVTYVVMNLIVVPLRFEGAFPPSIRGIVTQLFCHIFLVGLPIAWIAARQIRPRAFR